jgi:PPP family 3-phenylpropionic acid transporter
MRQAGVTCADGERADDSGPRPAPADASHAGGPSTDLRGTLATSGVAYALNGGFLGAWAPYWPVYFTSIGVATAMIGVLTAIPATVQIFAGPVWGLLADRLGSARGLLPAAAAIGIAVAVVIASAPPIEWLIPCVALLAVGSSAWYPLLDARTVSVLGGHRDRFGQARVFGSAGFIVVALATGVLIDAYGPRTLFVIYVALTCLAGLWSVAALGQGRSSGDSKGAGAAPMLRLLHRRGLLLLFVGSILVWGSFFGAGAYLSLRLVSQGGEASLVGVGWAVNTLAEVPVMLAFRPLARRVGLPTLIVLGAAAVALRNVGWAVAGDGLMTVSAAALSGVTFSFVLVGTTTWLPDHVPPGLRASAQALFVSTTAAIGTILGSLAAGVVVGAVGLQAMFSCAAAVAAVGAAVMWAAVVRFAPRRGPAPAAEG